MKASPSQTARGGGFVSPVLEALRPGIAQPHDANLTGPEEPSRPLLSLISMLAPSRGRPTLPGWLDRLAGESLVKPPSVEP